MLSSSRHRLVSVLRLGKSLCCQPKPQTVLSSNPPVAAVRPFVAQCRWLSSPSSSTASASAGDAIDRPGVPYAPTFCVTHTLSEFVSQWGDLQPGERRHDTPVTLAGRVVAKRDASAKLVFYDVQGDCGTRVQVMATRGSFGRVGESDSDTAARFAADNGSVHRGDIVGVTGVPGATNKGQLSVIPTCVQVLVPCRRHLPTAHYGVADPDIRYRQRYLDLITDDAALAVFRRRSAVLSYIRRFFEDRGFLEVETPTLYASAGGASARPFVTHANALHTDLHLRVAPELFLKQCVIGGMDRVFELGKVFRNEGITPSHSPEFTSCEFYQAYADLDALIAVTEDLLHGVVQAVTGGGSTVTVAPAGSGSGSVTGTETETETETVLDFSPPFRRIDVVPALEAALGAPLPDSTSPAAAADLLALMSQQSIPLPATPHTPARLLDALIGHVLEPECVQPTLLCGHPRALSPLAHVHPDHPDRTQRFELFVAGKELVNAYVELNDPDDQRIRFERQHQAMLDGDVEAHPMDADYCEALEYGLPPTGGWGMGVDRLVMLLTGQRTIRDVLLFPVVKPKLE